MKFSRRRAPSPGSRQTIVVFGLIVIGVATIAYSWDHGLLLPFSVILNILGVLILVVGILVRILAFMEIRNTYKIDKLVTTGIYSRIRNPVYLSFLLAFIGISIASLAILSFIWIIISIITFYWIAKKEENDLGKAFKEEYLEYKNRVSLFIPKIWENERREI